MGGEGGWPVWRRGIKTHKMFALVESLRLLKKIKKYVPAFLFAVVESILFTEKKNYIYAVASPCSVRLGRNFTTELLLICSVGTFLFLLFQAFIHFLVSYEE